MRSSWGANVVRTRGWSSAVVASAAGGGQTAGLTQIETVCLDDSATGYATFQSHNQKVVSNARGILRSRLGVVSSERAMAL